MSRSGGYKCYNIKCGSCIGKTLCGEPGDSALVCDNRIVTHKTNGDCIRSMSDEMRPNCDKPLTLRRLQEILESNEEIIGCPIIVSENGILSHAVLDARVDDGICAVVSAGEHWLKEKDYGKTWIAYAYPPAHTDGGKEKPVPPCKEKEPEVLFCGICKSGEHLYNEDGSRNTYCGKCGHKIDWAFYEEQEKYIESAIQEEKQKLPEHLQAAYDDLVSILRGGDRG